MKRKYSLFEWDRHSNKWKRISETSYYKEQAVRVYQNALLAPIFNGSPVRELRPVKIRSSFNTTYGAWTE